MFKFVVIWMFTNSTRIYINNIDTFLYLRTRCRVTKDAIFNLIKSVSFFRCGDDDDDDYGPVSVVAWAYWVWLILCMTQTCLCMRCWVFFSVLLCSFRLNFYFVNQWRFEFGWIYLSFMWFLKQIPKYFSTDLSKRHKIIFWHQP